VNEATRLRELEVENNKLKKLLADKLLEVEAIDLVGISRTVFRYQPQAPNDGPLHQRLKALASQYPRYGYLLLHNLLKQENQVVNKKRKYRLCTEENLQSSVISCIQEHACSI